MSLSDSTRHSPMDKEIAIEPDRSLSSNELDQNSEEATFAPITGSTNADRRNAFVQKHRSNTSHSLERSWSLNDGTSIGGNDPEMAPTHEAGQKDESSEYTVGWDENDPMNPRNMSKAQRWLVVIIVSIGSVCV